MNGHVLYSCATADFDSEGVKESDRIHTCERAILPLLDVFKHPVGNLADVVGADVHSQKSPVAGRVEEIVYKPGLFLNADLDKASTHNERNAVRVTTDEGRSVTFVQVAGLVARRILCYAKVGERLEKGERYGFIRFGSRVDVYLPLDAEITVSIGDKVTGVMSTIARL